MFKIKKCNVTLVIKNFENVEYKNVEELIVTENRLSIKQGTMWGIFNFDNIVQIIIEELTEDNIQ
jgi:hypothetical protein